MVTSLTRKRTGLGSYSRPIPKVLGSLRGMGGFLRARYPCREFIDQEKVDNVHHRQLYRRVQRQVLRTRATVDYRDYSYPERPGRVPPRQLLLLDENFHSICAYYRSRLFHYTTVTVSGSSVSTLQATSNQLNECPTHAIIHLPNRKRVNLPKYQDSK